MIFEQNHERSWVAPVTRDKDSNVVATSNLLKHSATQVWRERGEASVN